MAEAAGSPTKDDDSSNTSTANNPDEHQRYSRSSSGPIKEEDYSNPSPPLRPSSNDYEPRENYSAHSSPMPPHSELSLNRAPSTVSSRSSPAHSMSSQGGSGGAPGVATTTRDDVYGGGGRHLNNGGRFVTSSPGASNACSNGATSYPPASQHHHDQLFDKHDFSQGGSNIVSTALKVPLCPIFTILRCSKPVSTAFLTQIEEGKKTFLFKSLSNVRQVLPLKRRDTTKKFSARLNGGALRVHVTSLLKISLRARR